jgi:hypothetical protein
MATSNLKQISIGLVSYQSGDGSPDHTKYWLNRY